MRKSIGIEDLLYGGKKKTRRKVSRSARSRRSVIAMTPFKAKSWKQG